MVLSTNNLQLVAVKLLDLFMELSTQSTLPDGHRCDTAVHLRVADVSARDLQVWMGWWGICEYMAVVERGRLYCLGAESWIGALLCCLGAESWMWIGALLRCPGT